MENNNFALNRIFTQTTFKQILSDTSNSEAYYSVITRFVSDPYLKNNGDIISELYLYLRKNYRNEYFYKNTLLNKLLLGVHKPTTTTALTEIVVGKSKADFVLINGKAVVYEIKTALDTFERLKTQLIDYYKAFDHVAVLTDENNRKVIETKLQDTPVGIYLLTKKDQIRCIKTSDRFIESLDSSEVFKVMNKEEYESVLLQFFQKLPEVSQVKYYRECKKLFCQINISESYPFFLEQLKKRNRIEIDEFKNVPYELKTLVYFSKYRKTDYEKLDLFLNQKF